MHAAVRMQQREGYYESVPWCCEERWAACKTVKHEGFRHPSGEAPLWLCHISASEAMTPLSILQTPALPSFNFIQRPRLSSAAFYYLQSYHASDSKNSHRFFHPRPHSTLTPSRELCSPMESPIEGIKSDHVRMAFVSCASPELRRQRPSSRLLYGMPHAGLLLEQAQRYGLRRRL